MPIVVEVSKLILCACVSLEFKLDQGILYWSVCNHRQKIKHMQTDFTVYLGPNRTDNSVQVGSLDELKLGPGRVFQSSAAISW